MTLLELSSSNPQFKKIVFNPGLNIVAGLQLGVGDKKETYNGVGKSFTLQLIQMLFGARLDKKNEKGRKIAKFLAGYGWFKLTFRHKGITHTIDKTFSDNYFYLDEVRMSSARYAKELGRLFLPVSVNETLGFRQVFNAFARRYGGTFYSDPLTQQGVSLTDYKQMLTNLFLLGVDVGLVSRKKVLKEALEEVKSTQRLIEKQKDQYESQNIKDLEEQLNELIKGRDSFVIAENFDSLKNQGDYLTSQVNEIRNQIYKIDSSIIRKSRNLKLSEDTDLNPDIVRSLYEEAKFFFPDDIYRRIEEVSAFHRRILLNRRKRLAREIQDSKIELSELQLRLERMERERDDILRDLDSKGALEEYNSINDAIQRLSKEVAELQKFTNILKDLRDREAELDLDAAKLKAESLKYLDEREEYFEYVENRFRSLVKRFYDNHGGSLKVSLAKDAKYLFNIDMDIPRDGSQGVSEVKIFCYDILLYELNSSLLGLLAHDGCIFSEMDPRQKSMIFKVVIEKVREQGLQYFINVGESSLQEVLDKDNQIDILDPTEKDLVEESIVLELFDKDPKNWLFGTQFG
ncbi:DUF2326 domain-containing protein [Marinobacter vinifirmus]|uniref:DUF2326 domain-containing protein n=1 Tax=Marinobacter vinifirmus TaxID=355591 RepID=A0A558B9D7_9GAMM|nr:DUF2326 domain-containing protein [Marinobacter vinifirmus]TVT33128.1 MAG: DUF2326 domain-containing protein [Marinobacter vinifirmus]